MFPVILRSRELTTASRGAALLHLCMSLNQPLVLVGIPAGILAMVLSPALAPCILAVFAATLAWVLLCATTFLRAGHNFIRKGEMGPGRFAVVLLRFAAGQLGIVGRGAMVFLRKVFTRPKPIVFDRTPKRGT
jgi:hypothetical protein